MDLLILAIRGTSLVLRHRPRGAGQRVVAVTVYPRSMRESAASFRRYLELEGAPEALGRVEREGLLRRRDSVTRRYAKDAKTLVEVGANGPRAFSRVAEHPLEFVPERDPRSLRPGDTLVVRLLTAASRSGTYAYTRGAFRPPMADRSSRQLPRLLSFTS